MAARTKQAKFSLNNAPTQWEKQFVQKMAWFSLAQIKNCRKPVYPALLAQYLPDIIANNYPKMPLKIDLAQQPKISNKPNN